MRWTNASRQVETQKRESRLCHQLAAGCRTLQPGGNEFRGKKKPWNLSAYKAVTASDARRIARRIVIGAKQTAKKSLFFRGC